MARIGLITSTATVQVWRASNLMMRTEMALRPGVAKPVPFGQEMSKPAGFAMRNGGGKLFVKEILLNGFGIGFRMVNVSTPIDPVVFDSGLKDADSNGKL